MSAWTYRRLTARPPKRLFRLVLESHDGRAPGADSEEKHEPVSDIDTVVVDSLKALDPEWPIREADMTGLFMSTRPRACTHKSTTLIDVRLSPHKRRKSGHFLTAASCQSRPNAPQQTTSYSSTSSARASSVGGMVSSSALAVVRFMMRSNLVGCSTGRSPGFVPRKILSTKSAARR